FFFAVDFAVAVRVEPLHEGLLVGFDLLFVSLLLLLHILHLLAHHLLVAAVGATAPASIGWRRPQSQAKSAEQRPRISRNRPTGDDAHLNPPSKLWERPP